MNTNIGLPLGENQLQLETGDLALQADGAILVSYGDVRLLCTACMKDSPREGLDFFPLTCDFEEKSYSVGHIPGSVLRREGRPPDSATLTARLTDRPLRPLFPKGMRNDVQVISTLLASDKDIEADVLGIVGCSAALHISRIPFNGPIGAVRIGMDGDDFVINPTRSFLAANPALDMVVASTAKGVVMIEAGASQISEAVVEQAIEFGHEQNLKLIELQEELRDRCGVEKSEPIIVGVSDDLIDAVESQVGSELAAAVQITEGPDRSEAIATAMANAQAAQADSGHEAGDVKQAFDQALKAATRAAILDQQLRPDGRSPQQLRELSAKVGILPRVHGSGLFQRGMTQCLNVVTLGNARSVQRIGLDNLDWEESKRYMHHYYMPPYASGEAYPLRGQRRREIGHGILAERAIAPVLPSEAEFPYVIRTVSEILSSNGSTSMAATSSSSLALMDAGVPLKAPVTGISIGLISDGEGRYEILSDIQGAEDHFGDMDFKVAGSANGVTAIQLDIKLDHIPLSIVGPVLEQARECRQEILAVMNEALSTPRGDVNAWAPKIVIHKIDPSKIGEVIGPGGKVIRKLEELTGASIDIAEDGTLTVAAPQKEKAAQTVAMIRDIIGDIEIGRTVKGSVERILPFGAFIEFAPGKQGMIHVSELADYRVEQVEDEVSVGDIVEAKVIEVDDLGRINLSRRAVIQGDAYEGYKPRRSGGGRRDREGGDRGGFRGGGRRDREGGDRGGFRGGGDRGGFRGGGDRGGFRGGGRRDRDGDSGGFRGGGRRDRDGDSGGFRGGGRRDRDGDSGGFRGGGRRDRDGDSGGDRGGFRGGGRRDRDGDSGGDRGGFRGGGDRGGFRGGGRRDRDGDSGGFRGGGRRDRDGGDRGKDRNDHSGSPERKPDRDRQPDWEFMD